MGIDRRTFVGAGAVLIGGGLAGGGAAAAGSRLGGKPLSRGEWDRILGARFAHPKFDCVLLPESDEGPFYYESSPLRASLAEGRGGERFRLGLTLGGMALQGRCVPLAGAIIDIWHSDAAGLYSNVRGDLQMVDTVGQDFMRGHQVTDDSGYVEFDTVIPGWEIIGVPGPITVARRTPHIHVKAFYDHQLLTGQLYFPDALMDRLYAEVEPYRSNRRMRVPGVAESYARMRNDEDALFRNTGSKPLAIERVNGVLTAKVSIGMLALNDRGRSTLFR